MLAHEVETQALSREDPSILALEDETVAGHTCKVIVLGGPLGVPVGALYSLAEIGEHHALRVAVVSLAGALNVGLVADPTLLADVDHLAAAMQAEAAALIGCLPRP